VRSFASHFEGNTVSDRCNRGILAHGSLQAFDAFVLPAGSQRQGHREQGRKASAAELLGPDDERVGRLLNAVMIDDDHIDTQPLRQQNLSLRVDAVVDRDQQVGAPEGEFVDGAGTEAVSFVPVRQIRPRLNSEAGQSRAQNVRTEDPITVVIAEDGDPLLAADLSKHTVGCAGHPGN
jgi:hypothetical protein